MNSKTNAKPDRPDRVPIHVDTDLKQIDGLPCYKSEYDIEYMSFRWNTDRDTWHPLLLKLQEQLDKAKSLGAEKVVWRVRPQFVWNDDHSYGIFARCHFLPDIREGLSPAPDGEKAELI